MNKISKTIESIKAKKTRGEKITMLTAYDFPTAAIIDQAGIDMILVGDSLANVVLGLESTKDVGMQEMLHHTIAVRRAVKNTLLIGDMPYEAYQTHPDEALQNAKKFMEIGCDAVKLEWFDQCVDVSEKIVKAGIPLMGHVGLTPQTADKLGGFKVQGKTAEQAEQLIEQSKALEAAGCFSVVLECVPKEVAKIVTDTLKIPTIGIGAGVDCDGQVLVINDMLGLVSRFHPKFAKQYSDLKEVILINVKQYRAEVENKFFPDDAHSYSIDQKELEKIRIREERRKG